MANLIYTDKVWVNDDRKLEGVCTDIAQARNHGLNVVVIAHFGATLADVEAKLRNRSIDFHTFFAGDNATLCSINSGSQTAQVWLALASYFQARDFQTDRVDEQERLCVLIAEHHPMASRDQALLDAVTCLPCQRRIIFHAALTDALLLHFGGERLQSLLKQLGQQEEDCISHPMISAAIKRAQEKLDKQVGQELRTQSAQEWFKYNLDDRR